MTILVVDEGNKELEELVHQLASEGHVVVWGASTLTAWRNSYPEWDNDEDQAFAGSKLIITSSPSYNRRWGQNYRNIPVVFLDQNTQ